MNSFVFPGNIESDILGISSLPIPYMRTSSFHLWCKIVRVCCFV